VEFEKGHFYTTLFNVGGQILTFTCEIIEDSGDFIKFKDKFGKELVYNKSTIISSEEIKNE